MSAPADLRAAADALKGASSVVIGSHVDPDGDAVGSCLGLALAIDALGIPCTVITASGAAFPTTYAFLPAADRAVSASSVTHPDVFVALDAPVLARLGDGATAARAATTLVVIDHHPDAVAFGHTSVLDAAAAATGAIIWSLLPYLGVEPNAPIAACLYTALMTDTGRFSYTNTTASTLRMAAEMVDAGADPAALYAAAYENRSAGAQRLIGRTLERVTFANGGRVAYSWITAQDFADTGALPEESENLIDFVRALGGVDVVMLAKVDGDTVRGSLRSKTGVDVGAVARSFDGGGHAAAAGFTASGSLDDLLAHILPLLPGASA